MISRLFATAAVLSLAVGPVLAQVANEPAAPEAAEQEEGESGFRDLLLPIAGAVGLAATIFVALDGDDDDDDDDDDDHDDDDDPVSS